MLSKQKRSNKCAFCRQCCSFCLTAVRQQVTCNIRVSPGLHLQGSSYGLILTGVLTQIRMTGLRMTPVRWTPPFLSTVSPHSLKGSICLPLCLPAPHHTSSLPVSTAHTAITAAVSYPAHTDVGASNLSSIKAMQREFMLACHENERRSGESFEQVDR